MADDDESQKTAAVEVDDDEPMPLTADLPPEVASPLAPFKGERPPAPAWFDAALARAPERSRVPVLGAEIELLTWGRRGAPGLIFAHGNSAHADWWSFIAPFFADDYRVAALSFSGMGGSDWRERYAFETFASEMYECARAAGLYEAAAPPVYIGHSFGGSQVFYSAARHKARMRAAILIDTGFGGPPTTEQMEAMRKEAQKQGRQVQWPNRPHRGGNRVYASEAEALTRFRFMPPQVPGNLYTTDYIARHSLKRAPLPDGGGEGWTWKFDPAVWDKLDRAGMEGLSAADAAPMAHIHGEDSDIIRRHGFQGGGQRLMAGIPRIVIPDSRHHVMVDQPLALVAAMRAVLTLWPAPSPA
jgi:pimeloyl-ACP methyl ester carboxylesterase